MLLEETLSLVVEHGKAGVLRMLITAMLSGTITVSDEMGRIVHPCSLECFIPLYAFLMRQ